MLEFKIYWTISLSIAFCGKQRQLSASSSEYSGYVGTQSFGDVPPQFSKFVRLGLNGVTMADDSILTACILPNAKTSLCSLSLSREREPIAGLGSIPSSRIYIN